jgi:predicted nucleotidyltransferase
LVNVPELNTIVPEMRTTSAPLGATLFGRTRERVLGLFFGRLDEAFYVREVARRTGGALGAVQRELGVLVSAGILTRVVRGRQVYYQVNRQCPVFAELRAIVAKTTGLVDVLRDALVPVAGGVEAAFVFGSMARDGGGSDSDVDLFIIGAVTLGDVVEALAPVESRLGREVNPVVQSVAEFARRARRGEHFVSRLLGEPRLFVLGGDDVVERLAAARVADTPRDQRAGDRRPAGAGAARPARQPRLRRQR